MRTRADTFYTDIAIRHHTLAADEPASVGGEDLGPTPYDYLLAGTRSLHLDDPPDVRGAARGWPLEEARVRLRHARVHANDCEECEVDDVRLDHVDREVELVGPLDAEQRARLMEIADRCPVHRTLERGVRVATRERATSA